MKPIKDLLIVVALLLIAVVLMLAAGCATVDTMPDYIRHGLVPEAINIDVSHESHASVGSINCHSNCSEDGLTTLNLSLEWHPTEHSYITAGEGLNLQGRNGGGFYGPAEVFSCSAGYSIKLK